MRKRRILFLCTGNRARSQMAEGLARAFYGDRIDVLSAGSLPGGSVHPLAVRALADLGIDIRHAEPKSADQFFNQSFDIVVTVCDIAAQDCPTWPGAKRIEHWPIDDPASGGYETFVRLRDELARRIERLIETL